MLQLTAQAVTKLRYSSQISELDFNHSNKECLSCQINGLWYWYIEANTHIYGNQFEFMQNMKTLSIQKQEL